MTRKIACIIALLGALPLSAQAQQTPPPKPTKADVQKVVQIINADKAKLATYCKLNALEEQLGKAAGAKDQKKLEALSKQADSLGQSLGPEYVKFSDGMATVDPQSKEGQDLVAPFEPLDKLCTK
jgi:hypothetical protein